MRMRYGGIGVVSAYPLMNSFNKNEGAIFTIVEDFSIFLNL